MLRFRIAEFRSTLLLIVPARENPFLLDKILQDSGTLVCSPNWFKPAKSYCGGGGWGGGVGGGDRDKNSRRQKKKRKRKKNKRGKKTQTNK